VKRLIVGAVAAAALLVAVPAWAAIGEPTDTPGVDIVDTNAFDESSAGSYLNDGTTKRASFRLALAGPSLTRAIYTVLFYDTDGSRIPIGGQIMLGDGVTTALEFTGRDGNGVNLDHAADPDQVIYACALTIHRGRIRDVAGYDPTGRCLSTAGALELAGDGTSPGGAGSFG